MCIRLVNQPLTQQWKTALTKIPHDMFQKSCDHVNFTCDHVNFTCDYM